MTATLNHQHASTERLPVQRYHSQSVETWYLWETEQVLATLETSIESGLSSETAAVRLQHYGPNRLPDVVPRSRWSIFIEQFKSLPVLLLAVAAILSILTGGHVDAIVILGVVVINAIIGYATESQSETIIRSLKHLVQPRALVMRDGTPQDISAQDVVPGDVLMLRPGGYISADARLIQTNQLSVDESVLTGESLPITKQTGLLRAEVPLGDRTNMVYMGTLVTGGQGLAIAVATAQFTEMGTIQTLVGTASLPETPMEQQLARAGSQLVVLSSVVCGIVFAIGLLRGYPLFGMLKTSIALAVAAVPEGLPAVATTTLALGIQDMRQHKILIRRLDAIETLGSVQSLCLDKTGTLTANRMSVVELYADQTQFTVREGRVLHDEQAIAPTHQDSLHRLMQILVLCNESDVNGMKHESGLPGSSTENALLELAIASSIDAAALRTSHPLLTVYHRSEDRKWMQTMHTTPQNTRLVAVKGSPVEVLALCDRQLNHNTVLPLPEPDQQAIAQQNERMAGNALRVLGVAYAEVEAAAEPTPFIWLGLVGMADPIRKGTRSLMETFHQAGIDTVMITGDQRQTAYAIGKALNLSHNGPLEVLDSADLVHLDAETIKTLCGRSHIFARVSPAHKLKIVQALQDAGKIVAMTGDGINDAPALKAANVGVAMGHSGTDVAREVADVILEDDDLQTMAIAISRGRTIYSNIRKSVHFLLSTNLSEILVMLAGTSLGIGQPLTAMQLLWLNLVTDIFPGLALALEPPESNVMQQPPRDPSESIIQPAEFRRIAFESILLSISSLAAYGYGLIHYGISAQASTIAFMSLVMAQLLHAISCRSKTQSLFSRSKRPVNYYLAIALMLSLSLQLLSAVIPGLNHLLDIEALTLLDSAVIAISAGLPLLINEITKGKGGGRS